MHARNNHLIEQTFNLSTVVHNFNYATEQVKTAVLLLTTIQLVFVSNFCEKTDFRDQGFSSHGLFPPGECWNDDSFQICLHQRFI
jgi:hypothetical protein